MFLHGKIAENKKWRKKRNEKCLQTTDCTDGAAMKCKGLHQGMSSVALSAGTGSS